MQTLRKTKDLLKKITTSYCAIQQSISACQLPATDFDFIGSRQAVQKTRANKNAQYTTDLSLCAEK